MLSVSVTDGRLDGLPAFEPAAQLLDQTLEFAAVDDLDARIVRVHAPKAQVRRHLFGPAVGILGQDRRHLPQLLGQRMAAIGVTGKAARAHHQALLVGLVWYIRMMDTTIWESGIDFEIAFWRGWIGSKGGEWPEEYRDRTNPELPLQPHVAEWLDRQPVEAPRVLDVGAGPMTILGKRYRGQPLDLVAVDALAEQYSQLPFPVGLPLVCSQKCASERLTDLFKDGQFDLVYARNTLDHGYDPITSFLQMLKVVKPGGYVITEHAANEAITANWEGFHQWNFAVADRDLVVASKSAQQSLRRNIEGLGQIVSMSDDGSTWIFCVLQRLPAV